MYPGSSKSEKGNIVISKSIFAALDSRKKKPSKKKIEKEAEESLPVNQEEAVKTWVPQQVTVTSWADCDEDDDDYFSTTAPIQPFDQPQQQVAIAESVIEEKPHDESDADDDVEDEVEDAEEDVEAEIDAIEKTNPMSEKVKVASQVAPKETERQLSKKELKMKELAELDAVLAELGLSNSSKEVPTEEANGGPEKGKGSKKKKKEKKDKSPENKEADIKEASEEPPTKKPEDLMTKLYVDPSKDAQEDTEAASIDPKEKLKKLASIKKKEKGGSDAARKVAAAEAMARSAKAAASKKKEKSFYNQQPR